MDNRETIQCKIIELINGVLPENETKKVTNNNLDDELFTSILDSIKFIQLIILIESDFNIEIPDEYLIFTKMNTINTICDIVISLI